MGDTGEAATGRVPTNLASLEVRRIKARARAKLFGDAGSTYPQKIARYTVLEQLGVGGMGEVYLAYDDELGRKVAIKLVRHDRDRGLERASSRLLREAQALAQLSHPNVVQVYETGRFEGRVFIAMEFVRGVHLRHWLDETPRTWRQVLDAFVQAGQGLAAAHRRGMVHRDFKPENVLVGEDGRVRVVDFGLVRSVPEAEGPAAERGEHASAEDLERSSRLTQSGALMGTPSYMSPEQFQGLKATAKSDQFAFCVALYRGLYGWHPFASETRAELKRRVLAGQITPPPRDARVPKGIYTVLTRGLEADPDRRYPSMEALLAALAAPPPRRRLGLVAFAGLVAGAVLAVGLASRYAPRPCAVHPTPLAADLADNLAREGLPYAASVAARVVARLEQRAAELARARAHLCAHGFGDERLRTRHEACLDRRQRDLDVAARALARLPAHRLADAERRVELLPALAPCFDPDALPELAPAPPELRSALDDVRVLTLAGDYEDATQRVTRVLARTPEGPELAEALALLGQLEFVRGAADEGRARLEQARVLAFAARDDDLDADILHALAELTRDASLARLAHAAGERLGDPARELASALVGAEIALAAGDARDAEALLAAARARVDDRPATAARIELLLARIRGAQGLTEQARAHLARALDLAADRPRHPALADALTELAHLELRAGHRAEARLRLGEALAIRGALLDQDAALAHLHVELADLAVTEDQRGRAYDHYRAALALAARTADALPAHELARVREVLAHLSAGTVPRGPDDDAPDRGPGPRSRGPAGVNPTSARRAGSDPGSR